MTEHVFYQDGPTGPPIGERRVDPSTGNLLPQGYYRVFESKVVGPFSSPEEAMALTWEVFEMMRSGRSN